LALLATSNEILKLTWVNSRRINTYL